ncbi:MAG: TolB family protein [Gammaproteobacteria bacterium]
MRGIFLLIAVVAVSAAVTACGGTGDRESAGAAIAAGVPDTDIFLLSVKNLDAAPDPANLRNLTARPGYDNQPAFVPGEQALLFSSVRDGKQADIFKYQFGQEVLQQLTDTDESEYSPTPFGTAGRFSVVRVEQDGSQRVWSFNAAGRDPRLLLPQWSNVGYHDWIDDRRVLAFLVSDPSQLAVIDVGSGIAEILASGIGRSIHYLPERDAIGFIDVVETERPVLVIQSLHDGDREQFIEPRSGSQDFVIAQDRYLLMAEGKVVYRASMRRPKWTVWADFSGYLPGPVSRIAISEDERWVAMVVTVSPDD